VGISRGQFRRKVARRPENLDRLRERAVALEKFGQSEIGEMRPARGIENNITGLDITMQDAAIVSVLRGSRRLGDNLGSAALGERLLTG
jgi:hypothetical protein